LSSQSGPRSAVGAIDRSNQFGPSIKSIESIDQSMKQSIDRSIDQLSKSIN
jgi:hypothetical protein